MKTNVLFFAILMLLCIPISNAQVSETSELFKALKQGDSLIFEAGFNNCDIASLKEVTHPDLEFYHDQNGVQSSEAFYQSFTESICSNPKRKPLRKLLKETVQVYPLKHQGEIYGAIQTGDHVFYIKEANKAPYPTERSRFIHTWVLEHGQWKVKRILSYDHRPPAKEYGPKFDAHYSKDLFTEDAQIEALLKQHRIPSIAIGYIKNGTVQQIRNFGEQQSGQPISHESIYKVASLTKPVTALVTLQLIDRGLWQLDTPLSEIYVDPDLKDSPYVDQLTTRHVLSHQSGFPNWRYLTGATQLSFEFEPGTKWQYSGEGYEYLRKAIETSLNRPFEAIAQELLFDPLNMQDTYFYWSDRIDEHQYAVEHDAQGQPISYEKYTVANAAANLMTTVGDYSKFIAHISKGAGLSKALYDEFTKAHARQHLGIDWGLGMQLLSELPNNETALMHTGGDFGTKTMAILLKNSQQGIVIFSNSENGMVLWRKVISEYLGDSGEEIARRNLAPTD